ncbi:hypothetical protein [Streptomyces cremeus]|uniref:TetR family transcriptional regulator n=1 Tax=Streptomyces cremeus TaxID=66881 RepID=A0ABV5PJJ0_STRCM
MRTDSRDNPTGPVAEERGSVRRRDPQRTRTVLLDVVLELVADGAREPARKPIAERAGASERSAFVHFTGGR